MASEKQQLVLELLDLEVPLSKSALNRKSITALKKMLKEYTPVEDVEENTIQDASVDVEALKEQMRKELMAEMMKEMQSQKSDKATEVTPEPVKSRAYKVNVEKDRLIPVMNITNHPLIYVSSRTGAEWNWTTYGDVEYIEMQELLTMRNSQRRILDEPWVLIMDDEAVEYLGLTRMYQKMVSPDNIDSVFNMGLDKFKEVLDTAPKGILTLIVSRAKQKVENGSLDSMHKINALNAKFNLELGK